MKISESFQVKKKDLNGMCISENDYGILSKVPNETLEIANNLDFSDFISKRRQACRANYVLEQSRKAPSYLSSKAIAKATSRELHVKFEVKSLLKTISGQNYRIKKLLNIFQHLCSHEQLRNQELKQLQDLISESTKSYHNQSVILEKLSNLSKLTDKVQQMRSDQSLNGNIDLGILNSNCSTLNVDLFNKETLNKYKPNLKIEDIILSKEKYLANIIKQRNILEEARQTTHTQLFSFRESIERREAIAKQSISSLARMVKENQECTKNLKDKIAYLSEENFGSEFYGMIRKCAIRLMDESGLPKVASSRKFVRLLEKSLIDTFNELETKKK